MKIEQVAIACHRRHLGHVRRCVASIRYWYPQLPITLIKDETRRPFSTREIEEHFNVTVQSVHPSIGGWGWSKLGPFMDLERRRMLVLDADTVLLGKVIDLLERYSDDFIVTGIDEPDHKAQLVAQHYIDVDLVREFDPAYQYPGYCFNTGQMVITSGLLSRDDFEKVMTFTPTARVRFPAALRYTDQGLLNYILHRGHQDGRISVRYLDFWRWPATPDGGETTVEKLSRREGIPAIMHWAGIKHTRHFEHDRMDVLDFFEDFYYSQLPYGGAKKTVRGATRFLLNEARVARQNVLRALSS